jgi:hypothetical protein
MSEAAELVCELGDQEYLKKALMSLMTVSQIHLVTIFLKITTYRRKQKKEKSNRAKLNSEIRNNI